MRFLNEAIPNWGDNNFVVFNLKLNASSFDSWKKTILEVWKPLRLNVERKNRWQSEDQNIEHWHYSDKAAYRIDLDTENLEIKWIPSENRVEVTKMLPMNLQGLSLIMPVLNECLTNPAFSNITMVIQLMDSEGICAADSRELRKDEIIEILHTDSTVEIDTTNMASDPFGNQLRIEKYGSGNFRFHIEMMESES